MLPKEVSGKTPCVGDEYRPGQRHIDAIPRQGGDEGTSWILADRENVNKIAKDSLLYGADAVNRNMWTVEDSPYALNQAKQAEEFANYDAMMKLAPVTKAVAEQFC